jgi:hypothetical protein
MLHDQPKKLILQIRQVCREKIDTLGSRKIKILVYSKYTMLKIEG